MIKFDDRSSADGDDFDYLPPPQGKKGWTGPNREPVGGYEPDTPGD